ncbi:hypothetical protein WMY93_023855 [Mugilogobius chulae]|uniref:DRBM domain-containing protein n=1 Tax=Mugilogobius chulae TaxID=88201 RepID=A0AAW0NB40_9GOBI
MATSKYWQEKIDVNYKHEINEAFELAAKHHLQASWEKMSKDGPVDHCTFTYRLTVGVHSGVGQGQTIYQAKLQAARDILPDLRRLPLPNEDRREFWRKKGTEKKNHTEGLPKFEKESNPITCLDIVLQKLRGKYAEYSVLSVDTETSPYTYVMQVVAAGETVVARGKRKAVAKRNAAAKMLNVFGYNFSFSEPEPKPHVSQPTEEISLVAQELSKQPEEELPAENTEPVEATTSEESPAGLTQEDPLTPAQDVPSQVDLLGLLPPDVLPMLAAMGVIRESNDGVQWCEPTQPQENKTPSGVVVESDNVTEIRDTINADVTQGDSPDALEALNKCAISLVQSPTVQVTAVDTQQQVSTEETTDVSCLNSIEDQSCKPPIIIENTEPVEVTSYEENLTGLTQENPTIPAQDASSQVDLGLLPPDVLPMLAAMGVIQENNDGVQWCEPTPSQEIKTPSDVVVESEPVSLEAQSEPAVSLVQSPTKQVTAVDTQQQVSTEETTDVSCLNSIEDQSCKPPEIIEKTEPDVTQGADGIPREQEYIVPQECANQPEEETTIEDEEDLSDIEKLDLTNMEEENELEDVSRENLKELLDRYVAPYRLIIQEIRENCVGIDTSQDNETLRIVELGPENSDDAQVEVHQMVSWSRLHPSPSEDIIAQPEEKTSQNKTANVQTCETEESVPQEPATCNQDSVPEAPEQVPEPFQKEVNVPVEDYIDLDTSSEHTCNMENDPFYIEDNLPEDLSTLNIQELMDDILEPYSLQITAIQLNSVPIETLPKENITLRIVELGSDDENCDTIQADVTQMDAFLQLQQYQRFPWPRLQLTQSEEVCPLPQNAIAQSEEETSQIETAATEGIIPTEEPAPQESDIGIIESLSEELCIVPQEIPNQPQEEPKDQVEDTPAPETAPENEDAAHNMSSAEALFLIRAFVRKVLQKAGSDDLYNFGLIVRLQSKIQKHLIVDGQQKLRLKDFEKIGKKTAKHLIEQYGSADAVLSALQEPDTTALEEALNNELRSFQNRPKSAISRFFSRNCYNDQHFNHFGEDLMGFLENVFKYANNTLLLYSICSTTSISTILEEIL